MGRAERLRMISTARLILTISSINSRRCGMMEAHGQSGATRPRTPANRWRRLRALRILNLEWRKRPCRFSRRKALRIGGNPRTPTYRWLHFGGIPRTPTYRWLNFGGIPRTPTYRWQTVHHEPRPPPQCAPTLRPDATMIMMTCGRYDYGGIRSQRGEIG